MKDSIYEWQTCGLCKGARFIKTPSGYWLCQQCQGDGAVLVKPGTIQPVPENLIKAIADGRIK